MVASRVPLKKKRSLDIASFVVLKTMTLVLLMLTTSWRQLQNLQGPLTLYTTPSREEAIRTTSLMKRSKDIRTMCTRELYSGRSLFSRNSSTSSIKTLNKVEGRGGEGYTCLISIALQINPKRSCIFCKGPITVS